MQEYRCLNCGNIWASGHPATQEPEKDVATCPECSLLNCVRSNHHDDPYEPYKPFSQSVRSYLDKICDPPTEPLCDSDVGCVAPQETWVVDTVTATQGGCKCPLIFEEPEPQTRLSGTMEPEHPKACDHPCHKYPQDIGVEPWLWKVCPMGCGLPLKEKEEKP